jgi:hypothetical protein
MSVDIEVKFILRKEIVYEKLRNTILKINQNNPYIDVFSFKQARNIEAPIGEAIKIIFKEGGSIRFGVFSFDLHKQDLKSISLTFPLSSSIITGEDNDPINKIIESIILIAKENRLSEIYCSELGSEKENKCHWWVWYFPDQNPSTFSDWQKGKVIDLKEGIIVFEKEGIPSIVEHKEFVIYLSKKGLSKNEL